MLDATHAQPKMLQALLTTMCNLQCKVKNFFKIFLQSLSPEINRSCADFSEPFILNVSCCFIDIDFELQAHVISAFIVQYRKLINKNVCHICWDSWGDVTLSITSSSLLPSEPPVIHSHPSTLDVIINSPITLPCSATGSPRPTITWQKEGINIPTTGSYPVDM